MTPTKCQPGGLLTGSLVFMALAVGVAVLSGDVLLVLAVGSAIAGVTVLSRPSSRSALAHVAIARREAAEGRRTVFPERAAVRATGRAMARIGGAARLRSRRSASMQRRPYVAAGAGASLPVIQVLR